MKKILSTWMTLLVLTTACSKEPVEEVSLMSYTNSYYHFSLDYPETHSYCMNDICYNDLTDDLLTNFTLKNAAGIGILSIQPYVNLLDMSAVEFGKRSLDLNRENSESLGSIYFEEEEITFAGEPAFTFLAENGFEERGGSLGSSEDGYIALIDDPETYVNPAVKQDLSGTFRVIYVDHGGYLYRFLYSEDEKTQGIVDSFRFVD